MALAKPRQREVWWAMLDPFVGGATVRTRLVLILSSDALNRSPLGLSIVAAITTVPQAPGVRIRLPASAGKPERIGYVLPYQVRTINRARLRERAAVVSNDVLAEVTRRLAVLTRAT